MNSNQNMFQFRLIRWEIVKKKKKLIKDGL